MNEEMLNNNLLLVMNELRNKLYFNLEGHILTYKIPEKGERFDGKKVKSTLDLIKLGGAKLHNENEYKLWNEDFKSYEFEFQLLVNHTAFEGIRRICIEQVTRLSLDEYDRLLINDRNLPLIKKKLKDYIKVNNIKGQEKKLLNALTNLKLVSTNELKEIISCNDLWNLKTRTNKKLKSSGFIIKIKRPKLSEKSGYYYLEYIGSL